MQIIKGFDANGREDPIGDLFVALGVDTPEENRNVREEGEAALASENEFRSGANNPGQRQSVEGARQAIESMKGLIARMESADPVFEGLRQKSREYDEPLFKCAVREYGVQGLTELFQVAAQEEAKAKAAMNQSASNETNDTSEADTTSVESAEDTVFTEPGNILHPEFGTKERVKQDEKNERLNPEILRKAA